MSSNESYPQYIVTAVIVAHDGATWLPGVADALLDQTRAVQRVVAVDTGSRDRSGAVLASKFGRAAVFGMDRATGYGAAVAKALSHRAANLPIPGASGSLQADRLEWIWLLHDDCEPAPDALEQLLRGATETKAAAVLGPKLRDWSSRDVILEAGITLDTAARRVTGIEPREVDQGQHDGDRDALAVCSAGMLVRRDVWEQVGGFDAAMGLFMEDIDFCWRVHAAGYRVRVITDAICYHAQAAAKHRRTISVGRRARMLDRRNGLLTLLGNLPFRQLAAAVIGNVVVSLLRIAFFMLAKRLTAALDEAAAASAVLCHPIRLISMRRRRARGRRAAYTRVKADLPPGRSVRRVVEFAASALTKSAPADTAGAHHASIDPTEDDSLLVDNGLGRRLLTSPALLTLIGLVVIALVATRSLIGSGPLGGGSLIPAWGGASDLWRDYLQSFHPSGLGSTTPAPPFLAILAALATVLAGKPWLAIDVVLIGCVPLAGMTAMLAVRRITASAAARVWACVTYALLPVATGVIAAGRVGSAVVFVLLPVIALAAGQVVTQSGQRASRAAWAAGLLVAIGAAFVPLLWLLALVGCVVTAIVLRTTRRGLLRNLAVIALMAPVLLLPWSLTLISRPSELLLEAGLPQPGVSGLSGKMLILLSPGGPGLPPYWVTGGLLAAAFIALFAGRRRQLITAGWGVALAGLLIALVTSRLVVSPPDGGRVTVWAGVPIALAALGLLVAASNGADALGWKATTGKGRSSGLGTGRGMWAALIVLIACSTPLLAAAFWLSTGVKGPVHPVTSQVVPELVTVADGQSRQVRTLVLRSDRGHISYLLLRGPSPSLSDAALSAPPGAQQALARAVAALTTPDGGLAVSQSQLLADFDIGYVLVQAPVSEQLSSLLNDVSGLRPYSTTSDYSIWQLITPPARVTVIEPNGTVVPIRSGPVGVSGAPVPSSGGTLMLAEPVGGWSASVNDRSLTPVASPAGSWAQAFQLPSGGGDLSIGHSGLARDAWLIFEALALLAAIGLALPGVHAADDPRRADSPAPDVAGGRAGREPVTTSRSDRAVGSRAAVSATADLDEVGAGSVDAAGAGRAASLVGAAAGLASTRSARAVTRGRSKLSRGKPARERTRKESARGTGRVGARGPDREAIGRARPGEPRAGAGPDAGRDPAGVDWDRSDSDVRPWPGRRSLDDDSQPLPSKADLADLVSWRERSERDVGRLADAWPYAGGRDDRSASRASGPQGRAWPYQDTVESGSRDSGARRASEPPSAPADWDTPARPPAGRSPSGAAPPAQWSRRSTSESDAFASGRYGVEEERRPADRPAAARDARRPTRSASREPADDPRDRQDQSDSRAPRGRERPDASGRAERSAPSRGKLGWRIGGGRADRQRRGDDRDAAYADRAGADRLVSGRYDADRREADPYDAGRYERDADRGRPARYERDVEADDFGGHRSGRRGYEPDRDDSGWRRTARAEEPTRYERPGRARPGDGSHAEVDDHSSDRGPTDEPARSSSRGRLGRRGRGDRATGGARTARVARSAANQSDRRGQAEPLAGWPGAGGESLEPLPPVGGPARAGSSRGDAWRPDVRGGGSDWGDDMDADAWSSGGHGRPTPRQPYESSGDREGDRGDRGGRRWSPPEQDYGRDYEGDAW